MEVQRCAGMLLDVFNQALQECLQERGEVVSAPQSGVLRMRRFGTLTMSDVSQPIDLDVSELLRAVDVPVRRTQSRKEVTIEPSVAVSGEFPECRSDEFERTESHRR